MKILMYIVFSLLTCFLGDCLVLAAYSLIFHRVGCVQFCSFFYSTNGLKHPTRWCRDKGYTCQCRTHWFDPWVRKILWSRKWQPILVFLPGKFHGQRSLESYSPWSCKETDITEGTHTHTHTHTPSYKVII